MEYLTFSKMTNNLDLFKASKMTHNIDLLKASKNHF